MTRKHFRTIARLLAESRPSPSSPSFPAWCRRCEEAADMCAATNPRFSRQRFLDACGYEDRHAALAG